MSNKWFLISLIIIAMSMIGLWMGNRYLYSIAYSQLYNSAIEATGCEGDECQQPIAIVIQKLQDKFQLSQAQVMRCRGANVLEEKDFSFLNSIKNQVVELIYKTCESDEVDLDDANIEIYNFPDSHGD